MNHLYACALAASLLFGAVAGCKSEQTGASSADRASAAAQDPTKASPAQDPSKPLNGFDGMPPVGTKAKCPVMGTEFQVTKDTQSSVYKGKTYVFCCPSCKPQFDANPEKYLGS